MMGHQNLCTILLIQPSKFLSFYRKASVFGGTLYPRYHICDPVQWHTKIRKAWLDMVHKVRQHKCLWFFVFPNFRKVRKFAASMQKCISLRGGFALLRSATPGQAMSNDLAGRSTTLASKIIEIGQCFTELLKK